MTYKLYIMTFQNAHFGSGTLDSSKLTFSADRIFYTHLRAHETHEQLVCRILVEYILFPASSPIHLVKTGA